MFFCKNCGTKLKEGASFCGECGQVVTRSDQSSPSPNQSITNHVQKPNMDTNIPQSPRKPMSKKAKILTGIVATGAILLIGSYYFISHMFAPQSVADGFMDAIVEKDVQKVKNYITEGQMVFSLNDDQVESYINYLHKDRRILSDISKQFNQDIALLESPDTIPAMMNVGDSSMVNLIHKGKKWLIFDQYVVQIDPMYINVTSTEDKTDIMIGKDKVGTISSKKEDTFGPLLPGEYEIKAVVNGDYGKVEQVKEINFSDKGASEANVEFSWSDYYIDLYSWYEDDAILYVNGKSTNKTLEEIDMLGPIPMDGSVKTFIQRGNQKSKEVVIKEGMRDVEFKLAEEKIAEVEDKETTTESSDASSEDGAIADTIESHYNGISTTNYAGAYDYFSSSRKGKVTFEGWKKGLQNTLRDNVTKLDVISVDGNKAKAYIEMTSYDDQGDGTVLVQEWGGYWNLIKENGSWKLDDPDLEKLGSRVE